MKLVSFKVAKAIKEAGYPPLKADWSYGSNSGELVHFVDDDDYVVSAPTYIEVWLWLWREKDIRIRLIKYAESVIAKESGMIYKTEDPEEAIIAAIEEIVENDLLK